MKLEAKKSIDLVQFVDADAIDPIYFEKPFYILPSEEDEDAEEAYIVLRDALKKTNKIGLGRDRGARAGLRSLRSSRSARACCWKRCAMRTK